MGKNVIIYGAGEHGRVVLDVLRQNRIAVACFVDDSPKISVIEELPVCSSFDAAISRFSSKEIHIYLGLGQISARQHILKSLEAHEFEVAVHTKR